MARLSRCHTWAERKVGPNNTAGVYDVQYYTIFRRPARENLDVRSTCQLVAWALAGLFGHSEYQNTWLSIPEQAVFDCGWALFGSQSTHLTK